MLIHGITTVEDFDASDYAPHGIVCGACKTPLTVENVMRLDVTDDKPWERDEIRTYTYACVDCVVGHGG